VTNYLTPTSPKDKRIPGILTESCFNKRPDARPHDAANKCEFIVADYYLLECLLVLTGEGRCTIAAGLRRRGAPCPSRHNQMRNSGIEPAPFPMKKIALFSLMFSVSLECGIYKAKRVNMTLAAYLFLPLA
jgi:hypothetical protein